MNRNENDRGAALIHVAAALLALMAFSTFVMDYGVYWSARRQAQNAADAAALAGAVALGLRRRTRSTSGPAVRERTSRSQRNLVFGQQAAVECGHRHHVPDLPGRSGHVHPGDVYRRRPVAMRCRCSSAASLAASLSRSGRQATANRRGRPSADTANCMRPFGVASTSGAVTGGQSFNPAMDTYIPPHTSPAPPDTTSRNETTASR